MGTKWLQVMDGKIAYEDTGRGPLVVCVPSIGDVRAEYRFLAPQLVQAGYRVVVMDIRGMGESSAQMEDYSVEAMGRDLLSLIGALDAGQAAVVGTSMAAAAGVWAAVEQPEAIASLVLIGPAVRGEVTGLMKYTLRALFTRPWGAAAWGKYYSTLYPSRKPADFKTYLSNLRNNLAQPSRTEALIASILAPKTPAENRLTQVTVPVQVIIGSKDPDFKQPAEEARWVGEQLQGEVHVIEGAGHYPHAEMPEITGPLVIRALSARQKKEEQSHVAKSRIG